MTFASRPTVARIDLDAIVRNFQLFKSRTGRRVLAVVKANAYGHGAAAVARALEASGADFFCVAIAEEGIELRQAGIRSPILLMNFCAARDLPVHRAYGLTPAIWSLEQAREFASAARGGALSVQVKIDSGLTRLGVLPSEVSELSRILKSAPGLKVEAVFSHFSHGEEPDAPELENQDARARELFAGLRAAGLDYAWTHLSNSGAALSARGLWCDAVRPGISLYGVLPGRATSPSPLREALTWETEVIAVKRVPAGTAVGYGGAFVTPRESMLAVLPVGYDDGYRRSFAGRAPVLLSGGRAPIAGVVSMDLTVCDATETGARIGERAVLLGETAAGRVGAHDLALAAGTNSYEILCGIGPRVPRVHA